METGYVRRRVAVQCARVGNDEEINIERIPIDPPGIADRSDYPFIRNFKLQPVAQGNPQDGRELFLEGKQVFTGFAPPVSGRQAVVILQEFSDG